MKAMRPGAVVANLWNERVGHCKWFLVSDRESVACLQGARQVNDGFAKILEKEMKE